LPTKGKGKVLSGANADMGLNDYLSSVDYIIMRRKCMDMISSMNLSPEHLFYGDLRMIVLSNTIKEAPANLKDKVEMYSGNLLTLISNLENEGHKHVYVDGGTTIQAFINLQMINEMAITKAPVLLGEGTPLFAKTAQNIKLEEAKAIAFPNDFNPLKYIVNYA
jgi:dihydrofolate reductase